MNMKFGAINVALLAGFVALALPAVSHAGQVGYYNMCGGTETDARHVAAITTTHNVPLKVVTPNAASLAGLQGLSVLNCDNGGFAASWTANLAAITAAVNGGMVLIMHDRAVVGAGAVLPGGASLDARRNFGNGADADIDFPNGSPILTGAGGTLNNSSLDNGGSSSHGYVTAASLPVGGSILATRPTNGTDENEGGNGFQSCAAEGYRGTQLIWCKNICESELSGRQLDVWIHRWVDRYHTDPACAGGGSGGAVAAMEGATIQYPFGQGKVVYSTIPLDHYMSGSGQQPQDNLNIIYLPNVIGWALPILPH